MNKRKKTMWIIIAILAFLLLQNLLIGYRFSWGPFKALGDVRMSRLPGNAPEYGMSSVDKLPDNPLTGKKVLFLGSSVTYGASSLREGIPEYFAARFGCEVTKEAVSGTTLVDNGANSYVQRLLSKVDPAADYALVVVQLSTNDATKTLPLGEISEDSEAAAFDTSTITGAMEFIIAYARETWDCPVVFYTNARYDSAEYATMVQRLMELQEKWEIGVLDLWTSESFNNISEADRALYMADRIHPTKAGYRVWWCPVLEQQLLAYFNTIG